MIQLKKPKFTIDIANFIGVHCRSWNLLKLFLELFVLDLITAAVANVNTLWLEIGDYCVLRPTVFDLREATFQHLHEAVTVAMVVNRRRLPFIPA